MFMIHMPVSFKVGDTAGCRINGESNRVTWRRPNELVIEPDDVRQVFYSEVSGGLRCFMCGDAGAKKASIYGIPGGGAIVSQGG